MSPKPDSRRNALPHLHGDGDQFKLRYNRCWTIATSTIRSTCFEMRQPD